MQARSNTAEVSECTLVRDGYHQVTQVTLCAQICTDILDTINEIIH